MDFMEFFKALILGGGATMVATSILKSNFIPLPFEQYPRLTAIAVSIVAASIAVYQADQTIFNRQGLVEWLSLIVGIAATAMVTYKAIKPTDRSSL